MGKQGGQLPSQFSADQLTLFQQRGQIVSPISSCPPSFRLLPTSLAYILLIFLMVVDGLTDAITDKPYILKKI